MVVNPPPELDDADTLTGAVEIRRKIVELGNLERRELGIGGGRGGFTGDGLSDPEMWIRLRPVVEAENADDDALEVGGDQN